MAKLSRKWDHVGPSIFTVTIQTAARAGAVNLAQGSPDVDGPGAIKLLAERQKRRTFGMERFRLPG
jgi:hypothetical protein